MSQTKIRQEQISGGNDGWIPVQGTWSYASATTITVPSGAASLYQKGDKIKLTQTTVKYFYVVSVADTVLTVTGGSDYTVTNAAITSPYYSHIENPIGFPVYFNYVCTPTASVGTFTTASATGKFIVKGGLCTIINEVSITTVGTASGTLLINLPVSLTSCSCGAGRERAVTGKMSEWYASNGTTMTIINYDNSVAIGAGYYIVGSCTYPI